MEKNYQIPLCKECWHINQSKWNEDCIFFIKNGMADPPYTKETASIGDPQSKTQKEPLINYKKNTCRFFLPIEARKGVCRGSSAEAKYKQDVANMKWLRSGNYYGQS